LYLASVNVPNTYTELPLNELVLKISFNCPLIEPKIVVVLPSANVTLSLASFANIEPAIDPNDIVEVPPVVPVKVTTDVPLVDVNPTVEPLTFATVLIDQDGPAS
jgi:hypothetical protein